MKKEIRMRLAAALSALLLTAALAAVPCGCVGEEKPDTPDTPAPSVTVSQTDGETTGSADESFEMSVFIEGMEEKVPARVYEGDGWTMNWCYEQFEHSAGEGMECFGWNYDDPDELPRNILIISRTTQSAEEAAAATEAALKTEYGRVESESAEWAGQNCTFLHAGEYTGTLYGSDTLCEYRFLPAPDGGAFIAETRYTLESAEGVGARIGAMLDTFRLK